MWPLIIFLPLLLTFSSCEKSDPSKREGQSKFSSADPGELNFIKKFGLREGNYELEKDSKGDCLQGPLEVVETEGNKITVMIGGQQLLSKVTGKKELLKTSQNDCVTTTTLEPGEGKLHLKSESKCAVETKGHSRELGVVFSPGKVKYKLVFKDHTGKVQKEATCHLKL